ncbi:unnamed protein product [Closterium sp. NIES-53]
MPLRPANEIRARVDHLVERAQALQVMASQGSMSSSRVPVQIASNLKALQRDFNSVHNIIRLSLPSYLSDSPPSPSSSPPSSPSRPQSSQSQTRSQPPLPSPSSSSILPSPYFVHDALSSQEPLESSQEPEVAAGDRPAGSSATGPFSTFSFSTYSFSTSSSSASPPSTKEREEDEDASASTQKFRSVASTRFRARVSLASPSFSPLAHDPLLSCGSTAIR